MGVLVEGVWHERDDDQAKHDGRFERDASRFRNWVTADGSPGPRRRGGFKAEAGLYHLYAAHFCPWAHRTLIMPPLSETLDWLDQRLVDLSYLVEEALSEADILLVTTLLRFDHIKNDYYRSHSWVSPTGVVPVSSTLDSAAREQVS